MATRSRRRLAALAQLALWPAAWVVVIFAVLGGVMYFLRLGEHRPSSSANAVLRSGTVAERTAALEPYAYGIAEWSEGPPCAQLVLMFSDSALREVALSAVARQLQRGLCVAAAIQGLSARDAAARAAAARAVGAARRADRPLVVPPLIAALSDSDIISSNAAGALAQLGDTSEAVRAALGAVFAARSSNVRAAALDAMTRVGTPDQVADVALAALTDSSSRVRSAGLEALAFTASSRRTPAHLVHLIEPALHDASAEVRAAAGNALRFLKRSGGE